LASGMVIPPTQHQITQWRQLEMFEQSKNDHKIVFAAERAMRMFFVMWMFFIVCALTECGNDRKIVVATIAEIVSHMMMLQTLATSEATANVSLPLQVFSPWCRTPPLDGHWAMLQMKANTAVHASFQLAAS